MYKHVRRPSPPLNQLARTCVRTSAMAYYLGIDGGGTKTRCVLADEATVFATATTGGCSVIRHGEEHAREALHNAIRQVCAAAKISPDRISAICIGVTGAARPEIAGKIRGILTELVPGGTPTRIEVVGDNVIALEAAFGAGPGVIAIAGTGSIVYGRDAVGHTARAGGWGFAVSDEGSGYWIGRRAISVISERPGSRPQNHAHRYGLPGLETQHHRRTCAASELDPATRFPAPVSHRPPRRR